MMAKAKNSPVKAACLAICLSLAVLTVISCVSAGRAERGQFLPKFYIEAIGPELKSGKIISVQLPVSASVIQIKPVPSIPHFEIDHVSIEQGDMGKYLLFTLQSRVRLDLMRLCGEYRDRRLILVVGQNPIGSWRINKILEDGTVSTYVEYPEDELPALVENINIALKSY